MEKKKNSITLKELYNVLIQFIKNNKKQLIILALIVAAYFIINFLMNQRIITKYYSFIIILSCINIMLAISLNLITGITGQLSLGNAAFMAIGAYTSAFFTMTVGAPFLVSLIIGAVVAAVVALLVGIPTLKLKGDYFAIVTLGICEIVRVLITNMEFVGGARGFSVARKTTFGVAYFAAVIIIIMVVNVIKSTKGRSMLAIRENEIAAEAMGVDTTKYKVTAFLISAMIAGVAGGLFAHLTAFIQPKSFDFLKSIEIVTFVVLGGMGSITGSVIAAVVLTILPEALRNFAEYRMVFYALSLVLLMIFRPQGLLGTLEITDIIKMIKARLKSKEIKPKEVKVVKESISEKEIVKEG